MSRLTVRFDIGDFIARMIANLALLAFASWIVMLCLGAGHGYDPVIPNLSFMGTWFVVLAVRIATDTKIDDD